MVAISPPKWKVHLTTGDPTKALNEIDQSGYDLYEIIPYGGIWESNPLAPNQKMFIPIAMIVTKLRSDA